MRRDSSTPAPPAPGKLRQMLGPVLLLVAAAYLYWRAGDIPVVPVPGQLGPSFWPRLALVGLGLSCLVKLIEIWRAPGAHLLGGPAGPAPGAAAATAQPAEPARAPLPQTAGSPDLAAALDDARPVVDWRKLGFAILLLGLYVAASPVIGFALANTLFLATFMWLGGLRRPLPVGVLAVGVTVGLLYLFVKIVYLPLPRGAGSFLDLTLALYRVLGLY